MESSDCLSLAPFQEPSGDKKNENVEDSVAELFVSRDPQSWKRRTYEDTKVSPSGIVGDVEVSVETVSDRVLTELTVAIGIGVVDVSTDGLGKGSSVFTTSLTRGRGCLLAMMIIYRWRRELTEDVELLLFTDDGNIV